MKEDYLWDKTGSDAEIEKLENALQVFRYEESAPPIIPAKVLPFKKESPRRTFPLLRAIAACLALASISFGVWTLISNTKNEIAGDVLQEFIVKTESANPAASVSENEPPAKPKADDNPVFTKTVYIEPKSKIKSLQVNKSGSNNAKRNRTTARKDKNSEKTVRLTEEEKYAYDQLMLALSITSSKLSLVKQTVDGAENQTVVLKPKNNNSGRK